MSKTLTIATTLALIALQTGCATTNDVETPMKRIPGQAPISLASPDVHNQWDKEVTSAPRPSRGTTTRDQTTPLRSDPGPNRDTISVGFENIRRSTDQCLARSMKREGRVPAPKVRILVTIREDGKVTRLTLNQHLRGTTFSNCLNSHIDRWRFDPWQGSPVKVARVFILE